MEYVDAAVLEKAVHDADGLDVVADPADSRDQRAHAAHDCTDAHTRLTGFVEARYEFLVDEVVAR